MRYYCIITVAILAWALTLFLYPIQFTPGLIGPTIFPQDMVTHPIPVIQWDHQDKLFNHKITSLRMPVIIKNSPAATKWTAFISLRSMETLATRHGHIQLKNTKSSPIDSPVIVPVGIKQSQIDSTSSRRDSYDVVDVTIEEMYRNKSGRHWQSSGLIPNQLESYFQPDEQFHVVDKYTNQYDTFTTTLWISSPGSCANMHYDRSNNFVVQVLGNKTWYVFPPEQAWRMMMYSSKHPHYHQTQVDLYEPKSVPSIAPDFKHLRGFTATLQEGDTLFMPPYWFHFVEAQDWSLSISHISTSTQELSCASMFSLIPEFPEQCSFKERVHLVLKFARNLYETLPKDGILSEEQFYESLIGYRYWSFYKDIPDDGSIDQLIDPVSKECASLHSEDIMPCFEIDFEHIYRGLVTVLNGEHMENGVGQVCLGNFLEEFISSVVGVDNLVPLTVKCLIGQQ